MENHVMRILLCENMKNDYLLPTASSRRYFPFVIIYRMIKEFLDDIFQRLFQGIGGGTPKYQSAAASKVGLR